MTCQNFEKIPEKTKAILAKLGIVRMFDLVLHLPHRYEAPSEHYPLNQAPNGQKVIVHGTIIAHETPTQRHSRMFVARLEDQGAVLRLRFFHGNAWLRQAFAIGKHVCIEGTIQNQFGMREMVHPKLQANDPKPNKQNKQLLPIYPSSQGITQARLRNYVQQALACENLNDTLPKSWRQRLHLLEFAQAVHKLHHIPADCDLQQLDAWLKPARERICFDELLAQQLSMRLAQQKRQNHQAPNIPAGKILAAQLQQQLSFQLTGAQTRVLAEISHDLSQNHPMHRLLQGDVGAGKTIVAALAALQAIEAGYQVALMAPTEILAEQHFAKFSTWFAPLNLEVAWLSGSLRSKARRDNLAKIQNGTAHCAIGTHALFQDAVQFHNLGLIIVDEQHRFGVEQRLALKNKGRDPHQLMMSATPIPRTLAMSYYADLDVSIIDELPPGRTPIRMRIFSAQKRENLMQALDQELEKGRQAYWVCPLIEESENLHLQDAEQTLQQLRELLPHRHIALLHGKMKAAEKSSIMHAFLQNQIHILVATTVIEVGVDVPNASLMIIEHAERMGLSQLHQLRGRVGRGEAASQCFLLYDEPISELGRARLKVIYEQTDGFEIARQDLLLRGPGELLGARQSGVPMLRFADLERDAKLLEQARNLAQDFLRDYPELAKQHLERWMAQREAYLSA